MLILSCIWNQLLQWTPISEYGIQIYCFKISRVRNNSVKADKPCYTVRSWNHDSTTPIIIIIIIIINNNIIIIIIITIIIIIIM